LKVSPSPVLRSDSEAGWEKVPDRADEGPFAKADYPA
jgi:hypothetical protein